MRIGLHEEMAPVENQALETMDATSTENTLDLHWMELALDDPLFTVSYIQASGTQWYSIDISQNPPTKKGSRNMDFEIIYPLYAALTDIIEAGKTAKTKEIKIIASSREHWDVVYTEEFLVDQWSYTQMNSVMDELADQLTMKQNLNGGLLVQFTFKE